jgi:hypothetical protein
MAVLLSKLPNLEKMVTGERWCWRWPPINSALAYWCLSVAATRRHERRGEQSRAGWRGVCSVWSASGEWERENRSGSKGGRMGECLEGSTGGQLTLLPLMRRVPRRFPGSRGRGTCKWACWAADRRALPDFKFWNDYPKWVWTTKTRNRKRHHPVHQKLWEIDIWYIILRWTTFYIGKTSNSK